MRMSENEVEKVREWKFFVAVRVSRVREIVRGSRCLGVNVFWLQRGFEHENWALSNNEIELMG